MADLPKLTEKQQQFILRYAINGNNGAEAYRFAYNCEGSNEAGPRCWGRRNTFQKEMITFLSCISPDLSPRDPHLGLISRPAAQPLAQ